MADYGALAAKRRWDDDDGRGQARPSAHVMLSNIAFWVLLFALGSVSGWICETVNDALFFRGGFHLRALFAGPWCPVYGVGAVLIVGCFASWAYLERESPVGKVGAFIASFAGTLVLALAVEFCTAVLSNLLLGYVPWDYSTYDGNVFSIIAPIPTLVFGVGGMLFLYVVAPLLRFIVDTHPKVSFSIAMAFLIIFALDCACEVSGVWNSVLARDAISDTAPRIEFLRFGRG